MITVPNDRLILIKAGTSVQLSLLSPSFENWKISGTRGARGEKTVTMSVNKRSSDVARVSRYEEPQLKGLNLLDST